MLKHKFNFVLIFGVALSGVTGKSLHVSQSNDGIIGGKEVDITQYPHQVVLLYEGRLVCGGSILNEIYVLTSAYCAQAEPKHYKVRVGSTYYAKGGVVHNVSEITIHPKYKQQRFGYDVAIFRLSEKIDINGNTTKAVQLANSDSTLKPNDTLDVTGWGLTEKHHISDVLKAVTMPVVDKKHCQKIFDNLYIKITDSMLCAGYEKPGQNSCLGDSGGPVIDKKTSVQFGVVSFTISRCMARGIPTVYTYIPAVREWIEDEMVV